MNLLSVEGISKAYGERIIFEPLSFGMSKGQKIALIAKNGSGKTSILKIIAQQDTPDQGLVNFRKGTQVSYLPQDPVLDPNKTVEKIILASGNQTLEVIAAYEKALQNPEDAESYQKAFEAMDQHQAWDFETQYKQLLSKLKLDDLTLKAAALSGGQKKATCPLQCATRKTRFTHLGRTNQRPGLGDDRMAGGVFYQRKTNTIDGYPRPLFSRTCL